MRYDSSSTVRTAYLLGVAVMCVLLAGAGYWYLERTLWTDPAFIVFEVMLEGKPIISEYRYGAFITQVWPLAGYALDLPLRAILWLYSVSFYVFYTGVLLLLGFRWKQYGLGVLFVFYFTLLASDSYFWPNNEVHQAVGYTMLFLGAYRHLRSLPAFPAYAHGLLVPLALLALNTHMLVAAPFAFLWVYLALHDRRWPDRIDLTYSAVLLAGVGLRYWMSQDSWYDGYKLRGVKNLSWESFVGSFQSGHAIRVSELVWPEYAITLFLLTAGLLYLLLTGKVWRAVITVGACVLYAGLIFVTYPADFGRELLFYIESEWQGLALIAAAPFCLDVLATVRRPYLAAAVLAVVFAIRLDRIGDSSAFFERRLENLAVLSDTLLAEGYRKVRVGEAEELTPYFASIWGLPAETLLYTSLDGPGTGLTVKPLADSEPDAADPGKVFRGDFREVPIARIDPAYFRLDSATVYRRLDSANRAVLLPQLVRLPE